MLIFSASNKHKENANCFSFFNKFKYLFDHKIRLNLEACCTMYNFNGIINSKHQNFFAKIFVTDLERKYSFVGLIIKIYIFSLIVWQSIYSLFVRVFFTLESNFF